MNIFTVQAILAASRETEAPVSPPALTRDDILGTKLHEPAPVIVSVDTMRRLCEPDPLLTPIPPAALAAFDVPAKPKKNRAQDRAAGQRGKRKK